MSGRIQLSFRKRPFDQLIHFKVDGGRFDVERTVKLNVNTKYSVDVTVRPPRDIVKCTLHGGEVTLAEKQRDAEAVVYKGEWLTTGIDKSKKGIRGKLPIVIQFHGGAEFVTTLQCKFYSESEKEHSHWGSVLNQLEYECKWTDSRVDISKETFR